jgi:hypothetical protein
MEALRRQGFLADEVSNATTESSVTADPDNHLA